MRRCRTVVRCARTLFVAFGCLAGLAVSTFANPAPPASTARLADRLEPAVAAAVREVIDQAARRGLPTRSLEATALEGAARGASADRIVAAVRDRAAGLAEARTALGAAAGEAELVAGSTALAAGVAADSVTQLRRVRRRSVAAPLVVLADLIARGVPPDEASGLVLSAVRGRVRDSELMRLREQVAQDIRAGAPARDAASLRTLALLARAGATVPARGAGRP
jgi:hypothetical protein